MLIWTIFLRYASIASAGLLLFQVLLTFTKTDLSASGSGPYADGLTGFWAGWFLPIGIAASLTFVLGWCMRELRSRFLIFLLQWIFTGVSAVLMIFVFFVMVIRAGNCGTVLSVYCDNEGAQLSIYWVLALIQLLCNGLELASGILAYTKKDEYGTAAKPRGQTPAASQATVGARKQDPTTSMHRTGDNPV